MIRLRLGLFLIFAISSSLGQNQDLIDENSLDLALRNVIQYIESGSNSLFAYKVGHVRIIRICNPGNALARMQRVQESADLWDWDLLHPMILRLVVLL